MSLRTGENQCCLKSGWTSKQLWDKVPSSSGWGCSKLPLLSVCSKWENLVWIISCWCSVL